MSGSEHVSPEAGKKRSRDDLTGLSSEEKRQRRLEQNRLAAKRSYTKRVAKQSADHEKLDKIDAELEELRQMVKVQKSQIDTMGQIIAQLQGVPDGAKIQPQMNAAFSSNAAAQAQSSLASAGLSANETKRASGSGGARG